MSKKRIEICSNHEALQECCGLDFGVLAEVYQDDYAKRFKLLIYDQLSDEGFDVVFASGQRALLHGWNGAQHHHWRSGPCITFDDLTDEEKERVNDAVHNVRSFMAQETALEVLNDTDVCCPEQVADIVISMSKNADLTALIEEIEKAVANDAAERRALGIQKEPDV